MWLNIFMIFSTLSSGLSIKRPVYKAVLTQKGYAQFLQYDIKTPPIREFTFCTWFRIYEIYGDQTIFTYIANGNNRIIRLWLDSSGKYIKVTINSKVTSSSPVEVPKNVWRHVCLAYQSDYGAWALYMDSKLVSCQSSRDVNGFVLPGSGSVIIGYGTDINGVPNGLEGEVFGANMILISTIERNHTIKVNPTYEQKPFHRNRIKGGELHPNYVILSDLQSDEVNNNFETSHIPIITSTNKSFIKFKTPHSFIKHEVGRNSKIKEDLIHPFSKNSLNSPVTEKIKESNISTIWNLNSIPFPTKSVSKEFSVLSEYEVPPPVSNSIFKAYEDTIDHSSLLMKKYPKTLPDVELPPPVSKSTKFYGQWTSSNFANSVLNYLKKQQLHLREQKRIVTPQTIPLFKVSDSFPYASNFKVMQIRPPFQYQRRNSVEQKQFFIKRAPQFNVKILKDDLRNNIIKSHARTMPKNVEISNRGLSKKLKEHRFYRNIDDQEESRESTENIPQTKNVDLTKTRKKGQEEDINLQTQNLMTIIPFLKSLEYFIDDSLNTQAKGLVKANDVYTRSLSFGNKWHNVKSYGNYYTPREINIGFDYDQSNVATKIEQINKTHPATHLNYKHENSEVIQYNDDESILKGRKLAMEISKQSDYNRDSTSNFKYSQGSNKSNKMTDKVKGKHDISIIDSNKGLKASFDKQIKIGNALNERPIIGDSIAENKKSFVGGDERVPDINKYRTSTNSDEFFTSIPGSLSPRICNNLELYGRVLYVKPDESIDITHILSPVKLKNVGIEFIIQNYKKCSLEESFIQDKAMLFINWNKTPVKLFGGAYASRTTDLCGFF